MKLTKILLIGPFPPPQMGPAVRNEIIKNEFVNRNINIIEADTTGNKLKFIFNFFKGVLKGCNVYLSTSKNGQFFFIPILFFLRKYFNKNKVIFYPAGGQLFEHIQELKPARKKRIIKMFSHLDYIFVQTKGMKTKIETLLPQKQITYLPNPKPYKIRGPRIFNIQTKIKQRKLLFLSRIRKEKGVELLIEAVELLEKKYKKTVSLDFYGLITEDYTKHFNSLISENKNINYKGVLPSDKTLVETIAKYYVMIFPSNWKNEGFPGVLADAALAGLPVIASDVGYNTEIIKNEYNGLIFTRNNTEMLAQKIMYLINNVEIRNKMAKNNFKESENYFIKNCMNKMLSIIEKE